jgi:hypothetical protein
MEKEQIQILWNNMHNQLNEQQKRQYAATLAKAYGYGGATIVHKITGIAPNTLTKGKKELQNSTIQLEPRRIRKKGAGPKPLEQKHPNIKQHIQTIVDETTYGNPEKVLTWTTKSLRGIQQIIKEKYHINASYVTIGAMLESLGYSKQANQKMLQTGTPHPDRNAQFEHINAAAKEFLDAGEPVISVDTKKKEWVGNFKNSGREYRRVGDPRKVLDHDFPIAELGKIAPYGVYNLNHNVGFVNVGVSHDTSEFAVESISRWWFAVGQHTFPRASKLLITCDCGGSNGVRVRLWKFRLWLLARRIGLDIFVCHFPPGTSKWNKVEHRLFCYVSRNWSGVPLVSVEAAVDLIGSTRTGGGLRVVCRRDDSVYELARVVSDEEFGVISIVRFAPFEEWNYVLKHM